MKKDMKEGLSSNRKPDITHVRVPFMNYTARPCEYGEAKYERANFLRPTGDGPHRVPTAEDFKRFRAYLRALISHAGETLEAMEKHQANDPNLTDVAGMRRAAYAVDTDVTPGAKVGASLLPHIAPACASLNMAITQAVECGLLPRDPGTPWVAGEVPGIISRAEVAELEFFARTLPRVGGELLPNPAADVDGGRYFEDRGGDVGGGKR